MVSDPSYYRHAIIGPKNEDYKETHYKNQIYKLYRKRFANCTCDIKPRQKAN